MLIPPKVPSIDVDTSDGTLSLSIYLSINQSIHTYDVVMLKL